MLAVYIYSTVEENYRPHDRSNDHICGFQGSECWRKTTSAPGGINNFCIRGTRGRPLRIRLKRGSNRYSTENISCFTLLWLKIATRRVGEICSVLVKLQPPLRHHTRRNPIYRNITLPPFSLRLYLDSSFSSTSLPVSLEYSRGSISFRCAYIEKLSLFRNLIR